MRQEMTKTFCCLCCASPPLTVNFSLPVRGYVPGQSMPIDINVENSSTVIVNAIKLILRKVCNNNSALRLNFRSLNRFKEQYLLQGFEHGPCAEIFVDK